MSGSASRMRSFAVLVFDFLGRRDDGGRAGRVCRVLTWVCVVVLAVLSLLPAEEMMRTGLDHHFEHFIAYVGSGGIAALGYGLRRGEVPIAAWLAVYSGVLEYLQHYSPGSTPTLADFAMSAFGALCGVLAIALLRRYARSSRRPAVAEKPASSNKRW